MKINSKKYAQLLFEITKNKNANDTKLEIKKFLKILVKKHQLKNQNKIIKNFVEIWDKENGFLKVEVTTKYPINKEMAIEIENFIKERSGSKKIELENKINESLISGTIIKYGDRILDTSLKTKINNLKIAFEK